MKINTLFALLFIPIGNSIAQVQNTPDFKTYSKFDFIAGEKIMGFEDFMQTNIGEFPARWNSNGVGEVVAIEGLSGRWLQLNGNTKTFPEIIKNLPDNFTLEFEIAANSTQTYLGRWIGVMFTPYTELPKLYGFNNSSKVEVEFSPYFKTGESVVTVYDAAGKRLFANRARNTKFACPQKSVVKVSIWRQKSRLRVYLDEEKVWDLSSAFGEAIQYKKMGFMVKNLKTPQNMYLSGFRLAIGDPDTRSKLLSEGSFVTTGILFDPNSDKIQPVSYPVLRQVAQVMQENLSLRVMIVGHTDADGDEASNLLLSKKRATAIKNNLMSEFGIESRRLETDGKGENQPIAPNTTAEGKANNRRVAFVKL